MQNEPCGRFCESYSNRPRERWCIIQADPGMTLGRRILVRQQGVDLDSFATVTEFGVALAGFSALAAALTQKPGVLASLDRFRTINLLVWALTPAFVSTFPMVGEAFGAAGASLWRGTSLSLAAILVLVVVVSLQLVRFLSQAERAALSRIMSVLFYVGHPFLIVVNLINASGIVWSPGPGPVLASLIWLLFMGAIQLVRIVVAGPVEPAA